MFVGSIIGGISTGFQGLEVIRALLVSTGDRLGVGNLVSPETIAFLLALGRTYFRLQFLQRIL